MSTSLGWLSHAFDRTGGDLVRPMIRGMGNVIVYDDCLAFVRLRYRTALLSSLSGGRLNDRVDRLAKEQAALAPDRLVADSPGSWIVRYDEVARARYHLEAEESFDRTAKVPTETLTLELVDGSTRSLRRGTSVRGPGRSLFSQALREKLTIS
jgi:hypothetical protein